MTNKPASKSTIQRRRKEAFDLKNGEMTVLNIKDINVLNNEGTFDLDVCHGSTPMRALYHGSRPQLESKISSHELTFLDIHTVRLDDLKSLFEKYGTFTNREKKYPANEFYGTDAEVRTEWHYDIKADVKSALKAILDVMWWTVQKHVFFKAINDELHFSLVEYSPADKSDDKNLTLEEKAHLESLRIEGILQLGALHQKFLWKANDEWHADVGRRKVVNGKNNIGGSKTEDIIIPIRDNKGRRDSYVLNLLNEKRTILKEQGRELSDRTIYLNLENSIAKKCAKGKHYLKDDKLLCDFAKKGNFNCVYKASEGGKECRLAIKMAAIRLLDKKSV